MSNRHPPPYKAIRICDGENGWGVVSASTGALIPRDGLAVRLTYAEAKLIVERRNALAMLTDRAVQSLH